MSRTKTVLGWLMAIPLGSVGAVAVASGGQNVDKPTPHMQQQQQQPQSPQQGSMKEPKKQTTEPKKQQQQGQQTTETPKAATTPINAVELNKLEESEVASLQQKLKDMGLYRAEVDGKIGPKTRGALQKYFQRQAQLAGRGMVEQEAIAVFDIDVSDRVPVRGTESEEGTQQSAPRPSQPPTTEEEEVVPAKPQAPSPKKSDQPTY